MPTLGTFTPNTFKVGFYIRTVGFSWYAPTTDSTERESIPGYEILNTFQRKSRNYNSLEAAKAAAVAFQEEMLPAEIQETGCPFMKIECPIFEMNGKDIVCAHFQGRVVSAETLTTPAPSILCAIS